MTELEELLERAVERALGLGAEYAEARYHKNSYLELHSRNGALVGALSEVREGIGVRVLVGGALAFASTNVLSREAVEAAVEKAVSQARASSKLMKEPLRVARGRVGVVAYSVPAKVKFESVDVDTKAGAINGLWGVAAEAVKKAKLKSLYAVYSESVEEKVVLTSDGARVHSVIPRLYASYNMLLHDPSAGTIQRWEEFGGSGGFELLRAWNIEKAVAEEAATLERVLLEAKAPPADPVDVIVGSEIVGLIAHESAGHPSEADRILGREAAQAGMSYIKKGMIGYRIGNENATVIDDPTIPGSYGFYLYDDEGVAARPRYLYKEGVIHEHLHNKFTASVYGVEPNGASRAMDYSSEPIIRMSNTFLTPGDYKLEELIGEVRRGVYIKSYMEWNIDDERWSQRYVGLEAYLIENGELKGFVKNPVLEITTKSFYSNIKAKSRDLKFYAGTCGKGEPAQGVPVWFGGPDVLLTGIKLGVAPR